MKENVVIFICTFDPFHRGKAIYSFANYCISYDEPIPLEDDTTKLFLNTATEQLRDLDQELRLFYDYIKEKTAQTAFTKELDATIFQMKQEKEERNMYLTYSSRMMECHRDGYEEGLFTGREEGISIGLATGREEGISIGLERGAYQKALETAKNLLAERLPPEIVARCTNLPLETVQELALSK